MRRPAGAGAFDSLTIISLQNKYEPPQALRIALRGTRTFRWRPRSGRRFETFCRCGWPISRWPILSEGLNRAGGQSRLARRPIIVLQNPERACGIRDQGEPSKTPLNRGIGQPRAKNG